ncbi:MAG TPA: autotransporter domain-containing protein, partial [Caulobacteraceae bacterium]
PITDNGQLVFAGGAGTDSVFATSITGTGSAEVFSGILGLTGTNTFTGPTTVDAGATLQLGEGGATGTVAGAIVDNGLVQFNYSGAVTETSNFSGNGSVEAVAGTTVITGAGLVGGTVTIDLGARMQWGAGHPAFLVGGDAGVVDNGALVMNFGPGGEVIGAIPITGAGALEIQSGALVDSAVSTYAGTTTLDPAGVLSLTGAGSISNSAGVIDNGLFDISGTTAGASIVTLDGSGQVSLGAQTLTLTSASGTFSGALSNGGGLFAGTGGGLTIAAGAETLTGASNFAGPTTINHGAALQLGAGGTGGFVAGNVVDNGTLTIDHSNTVVFTHAISGTGALDQVGSGTTILDAVNPFTGLATVSAGVLEVGDAAHPGASLGGNVVVGAHGTLRGHGVIDGSVANVAGGVVAPGGTIGTLTVGSYAQGPTSTLAIEVSPSVASELRSLGAASLNGKLALTFDPGVYGPHIYEIVAGNPVSGTFSTVSAAGSPGELFGIFYTSSQVDLVTEPKTNAQIYGGVSAATIDRAQNFATLVADRFGDAGCPDGSVDRTAPGCDGYGAWAFAIGSWDNHGAEGGLFGFTNRGGGIVGGLDRSVENGSRLGAAFGYVENNLDMGGAAARASGPSYYGSIYGRLVDGRAWFDGQAFYMRSDWSMNRMVAGAGVASDRPTADSGGFLVQASIPLGDTGLRPYARFTYVTSTRNAAVEHGVGPLGFTIDSENQRSAVGEVGLLFEPTFTTSSGAVVRPSLAAAVQDNAGDRGQSVTGSLAGLAGTAFEQAAPRLWGVAGVLDASVKVSVSHNFELFGDVRGRFGNHQTDGLASVGGVFRF